MGERMKKAWVVAVILAVGVLATAVPLGSAEGAGKESTVHRGKYLVQFGGCNDCHTPWKMGPDGPAPDATRLLSGHPESLEMSAPPKPTAPWAISATATMTGWAGPWGMSFAANLTPDPETGLGKWTERNFIEAMRTGRHQGRGRPILPPMPYPSLAGLTDPDLKAVFAYLRSIPAIKNRVPDPVPPAEAMGTGAAPPAGGPAGPPASPVR
jgi:mono/diheme cytochrome c family protein